MEISEKNNRDYSNGEITVFWRPKLCIHSGECYTILPKVFRPAYRPWVDMAAENNERIIEAVEACPSGALTYKWNNEMSRDEVANSAEKSMVKVTLRSGGPIIIEGKFILCDEDDNVIDNRDSCALCRCGKSKNQPFCDGSHF